MALLHVGTYLSDDTSRHVQHSKYIGAAFHSVQHTGLAALCLTLDTISHFMSSWSCGVVVITSALHAEGPQFDPGRDQRHFIIAYSLECSCLKIVQNNFNNRADLKRIV